MELFQQNMESQNYREWLYGNFNLFPALFKKNGLLIFSEIAMSLTRTGKAARNEIQSFQK